MGHDESCPYNGKGSGAEEDGFALEHFYGDEEGGANPFVDPDGYKRFVTQKEEEFRTELARQKAASK